MESSSAGYVELPGISCLEWRTPISIAGGAGGRFGSGFGGTGGGRLV